jgi:hypothetical protein
VHLLSAHSCSLSALYVCAVYVVQLLHEAKEIIGMKQEIMRSLIGFYVCGAPYFVLAALQVGLLTVCMISVVRTVSGI